ncbi:MAG: RNA polymerase sigma factor [Candidatus Glassbacteria bacterium]|nr:RNA polymerase sigma factor [Candidatus Glassbacteria bacterium]
MQRDRRTIHSELLVIRFRKGDRGAFSELAALWEDKLFYFLRRFVDNEQDAWDLLQQTWVKVLGGLGKLENTGTLTAWLYRVARNTALDHLRRNDRDLSARETDGDTDPIVENDNDLRFENAELVHRGLAELSLAHREALTLFFLEEFSIEEIAVILGLAAGTIKSRMHYAKRALKKILEREGGADG